ncbi:hypothetical protein [Epizootic haematopoietic necrosis virus]|uniref:Uncharacterized protein n=1 Tax=Epizootic haematopoietic necrosis virus TaxID=100217 RepID=A0A7G9TIC5_9VIRU|nr:hypothetical protein [Epizootic haematopoietic necrosis virus]
MFGRGPGWWGIRRDPWDPEDPSCPCPRLPPESRGASRTQWPYGANVTHLSPPTDGAGGTRRTHPSAARRPRLSLLTPGTPGTPGTLGPLGPSPPLGPLDPLGPVPPRGPASPLGPGSAIRLPAGPGGPRGPGGPSSPSLPPSGSAYSSDAKRVLMSYILMTLTIFPFLCKTFLQFREETL